MVLIAVSASAPASGRRPDALEVAGLGRHLHPERELVTARTAARDARGAAASQPNSRPPLSTFGHETLSSTRGDALLAVEALGRA